VGRGQASLRAEIGDVSSPPVQVEVVRTRILALEVRPGKLRLAPGQSSPLKVVAFLRDGRLANMAAFATWSSDNPGVAEVDRDGRVTAHAPGTANITATWGEWTALAAVVEVAE